MRTQGLLAPRANATDPAERFHCVYCLPKERETKCVDVPGLSNVMDWVDLRNDRVLVLCADGRVVDVCVQKNKDGDPSSFSIFDFPKLDTKTNYSSMEISQDCRRLYFYSHAKKSLCIMSVATGQTLWEGSFP
jgi:hypothetical protein